MSRLHIIHLFDDLPISHSLQTRLPSGISLPQAMQVLALPEIYTVLFFVRFVVFSFSSRFFNLISYML